MAADASQTARETAGDLTVNTPLEVDLHDVVGMDKKSELQTSVRGQEGVFTAKYAYHHPAAMNM